MTVSYAVRVDETVRDEAAAVAKSFGLDLASATRAFWTQMARTKSIPLTFTSEEPNEESLEAIREAREIAKNGGPSYASLADMCRDLGA